MSNPVNTGKKIYDGTIKDMASDFLRGSLQWGKGDFFPKTWNDLMYWHMQVQEIREQIKLLTIMSIHNIVN